LIDGFINLNVKGGEIINLPYKTMKICERCGKKIPEDYQNALCDECYLKLVEENKKKKEEEISQVKKNPDSPLGNTNQTKPLGQEKAVSQTQDINIDFCIKGDYTENPEQNDKNQVLTNLAQFIYTHNEEKGQKGKLLWYPTRNMYNYIKNFCMKNVMAHPQYPKYIWKPKIVDVGCGLGVGSNIMSQEADFVWGIDKNKMSIEFAKEAFERQKNGIYYNSQLTFDKIDIIEENRELMKFDVVVAIEIIEHINDVHTFLKNIIQFTKRNKKGDCKIEGATEFFISTPNRNSPKIQDNQPANIYHCREWRKNEFHELLSKYFEKIELYDNKGIPQPDLEGKEDIVLAKCSLPKL